MMSMVEDDMSAMQNPFGAARPREAVLATRTGQKEDDILRAESEKDRLKASAHNFVPILLPVHAYKHMLQS